MAMVAAPPWSYSHMHSHYFHSTSTQHRELRYSSINGHVCMDSSNVFMPQRFSGMFPPFCTLKCNTTLVKTWKKPTYDKKRNDINETLKKLCRQGFLKEALEILEFTDWVHPYAYASLLQACADARALAEGRQLHAQVVKSGYGEQSSIGNKLVLVYVKCGLLGNARQVFDKIPQRNYLSWTVIIGAYAREWHFVEVLGLLHGLQGEGMRPGNVIVPSLLKACAYLWALEWGKEVHGYVVRNGFDVDAFVQNALVDMYAKCGCLEYARQVFDKIGQRDVVSWTAIIGGYSQIGHAEEALRLLGEMELSGIKPDAITWNAMMAGFAQNGQVDKAFELLERMQLGGLKPGVNSWNAIITGCAQNGDVDEAIEVFRKMQFADVKPNSLTIAGILSACADLGALLQGTEIHAYVTKSGFESNVFVGSALVDLYFKSTRISDARKVFDIIPDKNTVLWNVMIAGYAQNGHTDQAFELFHQMNLSGMKPNLITWNAIIAGYAKKGQGCKSLELFFQMHLGGIKPNVVSWNSLITGFVESGHGEEALVIFHEMQSGGIASDSGSWNSVIVRCSQEGNDEEAFKLFPGMKMARVKPNSGTIVTVLSACAILMTLRHGKEVHGYILRNGFECNVFVGSSLVDMYAKCKSVKDARRVFDKLSQRNAVSWNVMIAGYAQNGYSDWALKLFGQMQEAGLKPNLATTLIVLSEASNLMALQEGKQVHGYITRHVLNSDMFVRSALINMYAKCGSIANVRRVFDQTDKRDPAVWNAVIGGYAMHGFGEESLSLFQQMQRSGIKPDHITFAVILSACSRSGMVSEGCKYFNSMGRYYGVKPGIEHYTCMVNLLGFAGHLDKACQLIDIMPFEPDASIWGALLRVCRIHNDVEVGERVARQLLELEPKNVDSYVLLSNIYAAAGRWDDVEKVRRMMKDRGVKTRRGCSWIRVKNRVHAFLVGDDSHPELEKIYAKLDDFVWQMEEQGFEPEYPITEQDYDEKENIFCGHSEKLAITFGLINTSSLTPIQVVKNHRMCVDCHMTTKIISRIADREILVRDAGCFHYFKDGICSCRDSW